MFVTRFTNKSDFLTVKLLMYFYERTYSARWRSWDKICKGVLVSGWREVKRNSPGIRFVEIVKAGAEPFTSGLSAYKYVCLQLSPRGHTRLIGQELRHSSLCRGCRRRWLLYRKNFVTCSPLSQSFRYDRVAHRQVITHTCVRERG